MPKNKQKQKQKQALKSSIKNVVKIAIGEVKKTRRRRRRTTQTRPMVYPPPQQPISVSTPVYISGGNSGGGASLIAGLSKLLDERLRSSESPSVQAPPSKPIFSSEEYRLGQNLLEEQSRLLTELGSGGIPTNSSSLLDVKKEEGESSPASSQYASISSPKFSTQQDVATQTPFFVNDSETQTNTIAFIKGGNLEQYDYDNPFAIWARINSDEATREELLRIFVRNGGDPIKEGMFTETGNLKTSVKKEDLKLLAKFKLTEAFKMGRFGKVVNSRLKGGGGGGATGGGV